MMTKTKTFKGTNVFLSRNLVPPEIFDALHDALKYNGADVFLCCDPSRSGPNDYHIISCSDHEKFEDLRAKGCNLLGPQSVLTCAKENRVLPKQGFTCCLAMDGVKVLASGFEMDEKVKIGKLVTAMGGVLQTKASLDVNFVIAKNVLAAKYKWALNTLKKPIVTVNWLYQCWSEHRVVPQESYKVPSFSGLTICVTRIPADERKEIEKLITQNGAPEGDKYKVARRWGHIHIITRKWFDQSIARRACLNEESYPVQGGSVSSIKTVTGCLSMQHNQDKGIGTSQCALSSGAPDSSFPDVPCSGFADPDLEATLSQNMSSTLSDTPVFSKKGDGEVPTAQPNNDINLDSCVADDSQTEDSDLYLSECRIMLVGFEAFEMRKLVNMVRRGGGSRYMSFNEKLTHIVVGSPSEIEKKEFRSLAALSVIHVVRITWLDDCDREKKEVPVLRRHIALDLLLPKGTGMQSSQFLGSMNSGIGPSLEKIREEKPEIKMNGDNCLEAMGKLNQKGIFSVTSDKHEGDQKIQHGSGAQDIQNKKSSSVFKAKVFCFSNSFPEDRRAEIVQWVNQGGGEVVDSQVKPNVHFTIECHGVIPRPANVLQTMYVSSHWIRSCLEAGCMLDVGAHILYSPLPCQIPLPGFESFRFCVSQYEEKDRLLLRNLCFVVGAKFVEKLTKKVTHLLCKFTNGPKYEAACKWRIRTVTSEWIYECVRQNEVVALDLFCPKDVTAQDQEAGLCTVSQFPTQANQMISGETLSQFPSESQDLRNAPSQFISGRIDSYREEGKRSSFESKRARLSKDDGQKSLLSSGPHVGGHICNMTSTGDNILKDTGEVSNVVPDVAAAIEDLLEQTSKIHDLKSPGRTASDKSPFLSDRSIHGQDHLDSHSVIGLSKHWLNRTGKKDDICNSSGDANAGIYDGFSETQTDSQVVGYEEDLSGRQMIIDRVLRSSMT